MGTRNNNVSKMKRVVCFVIFLLLVDLMVEAQSRVGGITFYNEQSKPAAPKTKVVFWTNQERQGPIKVYVNGHYAGKITKSYRSAPNCGASGCVTVTISGKNNTWYGVASDGTRWYSNRTNLVQGCNSIRLYSSGTPSQNRTSGSSRSNSSNTSKGNNSYNYYNSNYYSSGIQAFGDTYGNIMSKGFFSYEGFPYFSVNAGYSRYSDGFVGIKYRTDGFCGFSCFGDFGFIKGVNGHPWNVGAGLCIKDFAWDIRFGNTSLCPNYGLMVDFSYDWYFIEKLGVSIILGAGFGDTKKNDPDLIWNWGISLSYKIWNR